VVEVQAERLVPACGGHATPERAIRTGYGPGGQFHDDPPLLALDQRADADPSCLAHRQALEALMYPAPTRPRAIACGSGSARPSLA
jgi:hypothetical protein